ncbi:MAG: LamG-like jellyroll fold domain-containing protein [Planctomycetota bacterium]|nr:LamG-like jellyroll fold domain-containing protein [Planctomycetota bacterium]
MTNKTWQMFLVVSVVSMMLASSAGAAVVTDGLVSWWKLDEGTGTDAFDTASAGNNNTGTLSGDADWTSTVPGAASSSAVTFDGDGDYVEVPNDASLQITGAITIEAWIYARSLGSHPGLVEKALGSDKGSYGLRIENGNIFSNFRTSSGWFGYSGSALSTDKWYHVAVTYNDAADEMRFYIDGSPDAVHTVTASIKTYDDPIRFGYQTYYNESFDGIIDEVRIYNRALGASEIEQNYNSIPEPGTMVLLGIGAAGLLIRRRRS